MEVLRSVCTFYMSEAWLKEFVNNTFFLHFEIAVIIRQTKNFLGPQVK